MFIACLNAYYINSTFTWNFNLILKVLRSYSKCTYLYRLGDLFIVIGPFKYTIIVNIYLLYISLQCVAALTNVKNYIQLSQQKLTAFNDIYNVECYATRHIYESNSVICT